MAPRSLSALTQHPSCLLKETLVVVSKYQLEQRPKGWVIATSRRIASLQTISATLASHKGDLDQDLSTLTAGLQPYTLISSLGQWFDVNTVYVCHGQETAQNCSYQEGGPKPSTTSAPAARGGGAAGTGLSGIMSGYLGGGS